MMQMILRCKGKPQRRQYAATAAVCLCASIVAFSCCLRPVASTVSNPYPFRMKQPNGEMSPQLILHGGPRHHYITDTDGFIVLKNKDNQFVYAVIDNVTGSIIPTNYSLMKDDNDDEENDDKKHEDDDEQNRRQLSLWRKKKAMNEMEVAIANTVDHNVKAVLLREAQRKREKSSCGKLCEQQSYNTSMLSKRKKQQSKPHLRRVTVEERSQTSHRAGVAATTVKNLVLLMRFADHRDRKLPSPDDIDILFNHQGSHFRHAPTGSIKDYFISTSYGQIMIESSIYPHWIDLPRTESYYADGASGLHRRFIHAVTDLLDVVDSDTAFRFHEFDADNDGYLDMLTILHSGYAAEYGEDDMYGQSYDNRIWSHQGSLFPWQSRKDFVSVIRYSISSSLYHTSGAITGRIGTIAHEMGHYLGLPDLYGFADGNGIGAYCLMSHSWGFDGSQLLPPSLSAWSKIKMGWIEPIVITESGRYIIDASATTSTIYRINLGRSEAEYLLIENRQPIKFDIALPHGGLAVWHIDENASDDNTGYPGENGWPANGNHYRVALLQADGEYHLERGIGRGDARDLFHGQSVNAIGPSMSLDRGPFPNTDAYKGGHLFKTGILIHDISDSNARMSFSVSLPRNSDDKELTTGFVGGNGSDGNMFDVLPLQDIILHEIELHINEIGDVSVEVYMKSGSYVLYEEYPNAWTLLARKKIHSNGRGMGSPMEIGPVSLAKGDRAAFYITTWGTNGLRYTNGDGVGRVVASNADVYIFEGVGKKFSFGRTYPNRVWNGIIKYSITPQMNSQPLQPTSQNIPSQSLLTTFRGGTEQAGNMFDILPLRDIFIVNFDIHLSDIGETEIQIFTRSGSYVGFESMCDSWTLVATVSTNGRGLGTPTPLPPNSFHPILLRQLRVQSFYITVLTSDGKGMRYTKGNGRGSLVSSDDNVAVFEGVGKSYLCQETYLDRIWNGAIHYYTRNIALANSMNTGTTEKEIVTTFLGGRSAAGSMFNVMAKTTISLTGLSVHVGSGLVDIEIFTKEGTYLGYENDPVAWEPLVSVQIEGHGENNESPLPRDTFDPLLIPGNSQQAFYITIKSGQKMFNSDGRGLSEAVSNSDLSVTKGVGKAHLFGDTIEDSVWNGRMKYDVLDAANVSGGN